MALDIDTQQFKELSNKQQMSVIYENVVEMKTLLVSYKFKIKWLYAWVGVLSSALIGLALWTVEKIYSK